MDLKLKRLLEQAQFTKYKGRGYDAAEVDDFLDRATAMAAKVEVQLTEALGRSGSAPAGDETSEPAPAGPSPEEIEADIERRVAARVAELPPPAPAAAPVDEEAAARAAEDGAEQARRTLVLAQRTADAAVREARQEAEQLLSEAREESGPLVADAEAHAAKLRTDAEAHAAKLRTDAEEHAGRVRRDGEADAHRDRNDARERLAGEIRELEQAREALRSDGHVLGRHVDAQRDKVASAIAELQRVLDDPEGIRLSPAPETNAEVPDIAESPAPEPPAIEAPAPPSSPEAFGRKADDQPEADDHTATHERPEADDQSEAEDDDVTAFPAPPPTPRRGTSGFTGASAESTTVDHDAAGASADAGPPTAPVDAVIDLDGPADDDAPSPSDPSSTDDAFLAELRKAMADEEPLGPRDTMSSGPADLFGDDRPRRFGRRR